MVRDARRCRAPHHEGRRPHPEEARSAVSKDAKNALGREPINLKWTVDVRFGAYNGLEPDIDLCPKSADAYPLLANPGELMDTIRWGGDYALRRSREKK